MTHDESGLHASLSPSDGYAAFIARKRKVFQGAGVRPSGLPTMLYDWQDAITRWAIRKGRAAIFADCGLGKTFMQTAWLGSLPIDRGIIFAPLCVAEQTVHEAAKLGIAVHYARDAHEAAKHRLVITNYERLEKFSPADFDAVVLDESSILKSFDGKTRTALIEAFANTPYRLCCTATPSPNDIAELANHAEFLGLMRRSEFLATWFVHDDAGWRMKRHAVDPFYRWLASWAVALRRPSDIGYADEGYALPPLRIHEQIVSSEDSGGVLFPELGLKGIGGRIRARKAALEPRVAAAAEIAASPGQWLMWCGLNDESQALAAAIPNAVEVTGSDAYAEKVGAVEAFVRGDIRVLVSKPRILGFGLNLQNCHQMAFVGMSDSYEAYYQTIRRCWRYGQTQPVDTWVIVSDAERAVVANVRRKEATADELSASLLKHLAIFEQEELSA